MPAVTLPDAAIDDVLETMIAEGQAAGDNGHFVDISRIAVGEKSGSVLESAAAAIGPQVTIEIGCASGMSTLFICRGMQRHGEIGARCIHVIDPKQTSHWKNIGRRAIRGAGLAEAVCFHEEPAHVVLPRLLQYGVRTQMVFLDGWHMLDYVLVEAFYCDMMLDVGGVMAIHDVWMPAVQHFCAFWCANRSYAPVRVRGEQLEASPAIHDAWYDPAYVPVSEYAEQHILPHLDRNILLLRKTDRDRRRWDDFTDFLKSAHAPAPMGWQSRML